MTAPHRALPARPSEEHLRKVAKRLAKSGHLTLASAQRRLAAEHGFRSWAALMQEVVGSAGSLGESLSPLARAAAQADEAAVREMLSRGVNPDGERDGTHPPLWHACHSAAPAERRIAVARLLLEGGASPRRTGHDNATALHAAARRGPLELVELLIRRGALSWQGDRRGRTALDHARKGSASDRDAIIALLDRPVIRDPRFRAAVAAIQAGDVAGLSGLLDRSPGLLRACAVEPDCYPQDYFRDPKLFWFIANNPTLMRRVPANIVEIARTMLVRGVDQADLDYTLELTMTNGDQRRTRQAELISVLIDAGAQATSKAIVMTLAHQLHPPVEMLLARGMILTAPIAAALGRAELRPLLRQASPDDRQLAFGLAVINGEVEAARLCLNAGTDPNAFLPVHRHSTPLHQAAANDDPEMLALLLERGARLDARDTLWDSTPLGWAAHTKKRRAEAYLRARSGA